MQNKLPFTDAVDLEILMMGYAHFNGDFSQMKQALEDYPSHPLNSFPREHLEKVFHLMAHSTEDLFLLLPSKAQEAVRDAQNMLKKMQTTLHDAPDSIEAKVNQLILYVGDDPYPLIDELVMESKKSLSYLIKALKNPLYNDPLYPGFGTSIPKIADAIKGIQDPLAIPDLFYALLEQNNKNEDPCPLCGFATLRARPNEYRQSVSPYLPAWATCQKGPRARQPVIAIGSVIAGPRIRQHSEFARRLH